MRVTVAGYGHVGKSIVNCFSKRHSVQIYDPLLGIGDTGLLEDTDATIVCVPTPSCEREGLDSSAVEAVVAKSCRHLTIVKSTIPLGTVDRLSEKFGMSDQLVYCPEYIGESTYPVPQLNDMPSPSEELLHPFFIFGGAGSATTKAINLYQSVCGPHPKYYAADSTTVELVKLMSNAWIASKVAFCNEMYDICSREGVDYNLLREMWLLDGRVGRSHTVVFPTDRGFGGKCLPKDLHALIACARMSGVEPLILRAVERRNNQWRNNLANSRNRNS